MSQRPFSFAVQAAPAKHADRWAGLARQAERLGYRALVVPDHQGSGGPITAMSIAGAHTSTLRVGPLVMCADFHNPAVLGQELMTLDALLGGRVELGLGAGWMISDYTRTGIPMAGASARLGRLREFVTALRELWTGGTAAPPPVSASPCLVLGGGGRRMLEFAAEQADIVNLGAPMASGRKEAILGSDALLSAFERRVAWVAAASRSRPSAPQLQCLAFVTHVADDPAGYAERHVSAGFGLPVADILASPLTLIGTIDEICDKLERLREHLGISYWVVKSPAMDEFAPVVARLAGR